tara:strand:- start:127 stop:486 length:360 start_codon:yes stop_codon:yes gene_type:complete
MEVFRSFRFHAARFLPNLDNTHICKKMHGHTFNITIHVKGKINTNDGFVMDFFDIDKILNKYVISIIDHKVLNDIDGLENPTSEHLSKWIWDKIINKIPTLSKVVLSEDHGTGIIYKGE